jgi:hypothetical protein
VNELREWLLISAIIVTTLVVIGLILIFVVLKKKKEGKIGEANYKVFFILGFSWIPIGVVFMITVNLVIGIAFMSLGIAYLSIGLANRDKWEKN